MIYCNYCDCNGCKYGNMDDVKLYHAKTFNNDWICNVCYKYDLCTSGPLRNKNGPCENDECIHRPKIISNWVR